jgi:nucleotide-binding universal stress UspA family protein
MLIVGRRSHAGLGALLVGHVSSACIAHADCPVLVVHVAEAAEES